KPAEKPGEKPVEPKPPEPKPPEPKPMPKPPEMDPFREFPAGFAEIPVPSKDAAAPGPVNIGKLYAPPKSLVIVHLYGGETAIKGKSKFVLEASEGGTADRDWDVTMRESETDPNAQKIAHLSLKNDMLAFEWLPPAQSHPAAPHLTNCVLHLASGPKSRYLALRKPISAPPLTLDLKKGAIKGKWDIPYPPNPDKIKVKLTFEGPFPPAKFDGAEEIDADKGNVLVWFGATADEQLLALRVTSDLRKSLELGVEPYFRLITVGAKPDKLTTANIKKAQQAVVLGRAQAMAFEQAAKKAAAGKNDELSKTRVDQAEENLKQTDKVGKNFEALGGLVESLSGNGKIHVRVFYQAEDQKIDLLKTGE
ncbi:MAG TPA: hypothetical protein PLV92_21675, partial [Pirellulaceae bacterium]|nr:hypothetical protein [Pirellulaceae bacterium]